MREVFDRLLAPVRRRLRLIVTRGVVAASDDDARLQTLSLALLADEHRSKIPRLQQFGFSSRPPEGAEVLAVSVGGDRAQMMAIACDDRRTRPTGLEPGECCLWTPDSGKRVHCRANGQVDLGGEPEDFVALAAKVRSELDAIKGDLDALKSWAGTHAHAVSTSGTANAQTGSTTSVLSSPSLTWSPSDVAAEEVRAR